MSIIPLRAPEGMTSFSHQGHPQQIGRDGVVQVDDRHATDFAAHGFTPADEPRQTAAGLAADRVFAADPRPDAREAPADPYAGLSPERRALFSRLDALPETALDRLVAALEATTAPMSDPRAIPSPPAPAPAAPPVDPLAAPAPGGKLTEAQIETMTKAQLVAYCKAHDIPMDSPIDADVLRMKVKHAEAQG